MSLKGTIEDIEIFLKRPKMALVALLILALIWMLTEFIIDFRKPFWHIDGLYTGVAEGNPFQFCIKAYDSQIKAQMWWPTSTNQQLDYVEYAGDIKENHIDLNWHRNPDHPYPDEGIAVIVKNTDGTLGGYWESTKLKNNRQPWTLSKKENQCSLKNWTG